MSTARLATITAAVLEAIRTDTLTAGMQREYRAACVEAEREERIAAHCQWCADGTDCPKHPSQGEEPLGPYRTPAPKPETVDEQEAREAAQWCRSQRSDAPEFLCVLKPGHTGPHRAFDPRRGDRYDHPPYTWPNYDLTITGTEAVAEAERAAAHCGLCADKGVPAERWCRADCPGYPPGVYACELIAGHDGPHRSRPNVPIEMGVWNVWDDAPDDMRASVQNALHDDAEPGRDGT